MKSSPAPVGSRIADSFPFSLGGTREEALRLQETGIDGVAAYLGVITPERVSFIVEAGMGFLPVTRAGAYSNGAADEIKALKDLHVPSGTTVFLDLEGLSAYHSDPVALCHLLDEWATPINAGGWIASLYVGSPQPLTSRELYVRPFFRYWLGIGRCVDRFGALAEPDCGWCMVQEWHGQPNGMLWKDTGVLVDTNGVGMDHKGRLPVWVTA